MLLAPFFEPFVITSDVNRALRLSVGGFALLAACLAPGAASAEDGRAGVEFFEKRIRPLLHRSCYECHNKGDDSKGGLQLDTREHLVAGGYTGPAIVPGSPDQSLLLAAVRQQGELKMPPKAKLTHEEIDALSRWVAMGAPWPKEERAAAAARSSSGLWSLEPVSDPPLPKVNDVAWPKSPIDHFILTKLEERGLRPAAPADKRTLLRRLTFDLTGLPPTRAEIEEFVADETPEVVAKAVDRLLASPHYGERWARHWMDLVRFAETNGDAKNRDKPCAWRYRDYCIEAFNSDVSYDQFVCEHLAGDLVEPRLSADGRLIMSPIGSGSLWFEEMVDFVTDWPQAQAVEMENQLEVLGKSFLGLSVACARCHDHKFDPIKSSDYYSLAGVLMSSTDVQACVDSPKRQAEARAAAAALAEIEDQEQALFAKAAASEAFRRQRMAEARKISRYLLATRELLQPESGDCDDEEHIQAVAKRHDLEPKRLRRWLDELSHAVAREDRIFSSWVRLARCTDDVFDYRKLAVARRAATANENLENLHIEPLFDFEEDNYDGWTVAGAAFGAGPDRRHPSGVSGYLGQGFASSHAASDAFTGKLLSPRFRVDRKNLMLGFLVAGGNHPERTCVNLIVHSQAMHQADGCSVTGNNSHRFEPRFLNLIPFVNRECAIELVDEEQAEWGHIMADHFFLFQLPEGANESAAEGALFADNRAVAELLRGDYHNHAELAGAFQDLVVDALDRWQTELAQALAHPETVGDCEAMRFVRDNLSYDARNELLAWALAEDSPLGNREEAVQWLSAEEQQELAALRERRRRIEADVEPASIALVSAEARPRNAQVQLRGDAHRLGVEVPRGYLAAICGDRMPTVTKGSGRRELAQWMASPDNPLTARVMVNRIWQHHFGRGLVASVDDFGTRGDAPSHPQLLDYLASRFVESGWSIKAMHRLMLLSSAYQQSSRESSEAKQTDPDNVLLSHMPIRRLEAECIRDSILACSGSLQPELYGPSISLRPASDERREYIPPMHQMAERAPRRTIYLEVRRWHLPELLTLFDFPSPLTCVGKRPVSVVPLQSLNLMNDRFVVEQARKWGTRMAQSPAGVAERISEIYETALGRPPSLPEIQTAEKFLNEQRARHRDAAAANADEMAWVDLCHLTFNLSEFIFVR